MSQIDDVESIHDYMLNTPSKTSAAETIRVQTLKFYESAGFWDKNLSSDWYDQLRTKRNQYNLANAVTAQDKAAVEKVLATGLTSEEMQGKSRPTVDKKTGAVGSAAKKATVSLSSAGQPILTRVLKKGINGEDVKAWQTFLGLTPATGYFDALTDSKTRAFQGKSHLTADGAVGKMTWNAAFPIVKTSDISPSNAAAVFSPSATPQFAPAKTPTTSFTPSPGAPKATPPKQSAAPAQSSRPAASAVKIATAGLVDIDPSKWSTGGKVVGASAALLLVAGAVMHKQDEKRHGHR